MKKPFFLFHETMVDMTWQEVEKASEEGAIILMTTAVVEEHGPHMSCGIDTYLGDPANFNAEEAKKLVKEECKSMADAIESLIANKKK